METFIERLKELRIEKKLSQAQLAKETGLTQADIASLEVGKRVPRALAIIALANYFNVSSDYLLGLE